VKDLLKDLNKAFENKVRLGIMSALMVNDYMDFNALKSVLEVFKITDGNLASHLKSLEKFEYIKYEKGFVGRKPNTKYMATESGKDAFTRHVKAIEQLIK